MVQYRLTGLKQMSEREMTVWFDPDLKGTSMSVRLFCNQRT